MADGEFVVITIKNYENLLRCGYTGNCGFEITEGCTVTDESILTVLFGKQS